MSLIVFVIHFVIVWGSFFCSSVCWFLFLFAVSVVLAVGILKGKSLLSYAFAIFEIFNGVAKSTISPEELVIIKRNVFILLGTFVCLCVVFAILDAKGLIKPVEVTSDDNEAQTNEDSGVLPETSKEIQLDADPCITPCYNQTQEIKQCKNTKSVEDIMKEIDHMDGLEFEYWCADLLRKLNYEDVENTVVSGDQGVDIVAVKDGKRYAIQCKRYSSTLGNASIQEVFAGKIFYHCDVAVVMTNSDFTSPARELAAATHVKLWDRSKIKRMIKKLDQ